MRDFRACNAKKVKRAAFQKHHTALCNEARYITSAASPDTHRPALGDLQLFTGTQIHHSLVHLTDLVSLHSICPLPLLPLLPLGPMNLHIQFS